MGILDRLGEIEKNIHSLIEGSFKKVPTPLEIRKSILAEIKDEIIPVGENIFKFPFNYLTIYILAENNKTKAILEASIIENDRLLNDIIQQLKAANCVFPKYLKINFHLIDQPAAELRDIADKGFYIQYDRQDLSKPDTKPHVQLVILSGVAEQEQYMMSKTGIHLGRLSKVTDQNGNVIRCNDVAFLDVDNEINPTVSRSHAHIRFDEKSGEFRLYDDDSACGTCIFREGQRIEVPQGGRGIKLHPGDEIYLGHACIRFEVGDSR